MLPQDIFPGVTWHHGVSLATILGAAASSAAVIWAVLSTLHERRERKAAQDALQTERREAREAATRVQADRVVAWYESVADDRVKEYDGGAINPRVGRRQTLFVQNHSDAPVFDVNVVMVDDEHRRNEIYRAKVLPPGNIKHDLGIRSDIPDLMIVMYFNDLAGLRWERCDIGHAEIADASLAEADPAV
ncbi:hypothetical protein [Myceligenerans xiligouense]|nr:hypothetical protein [Myceligenerans xiligouense]